MLGLYDSGLGGLTVLAALRRAGIDQDIVYFADQAHVPYGDRSDDELYAFLAENLSLLDAHGADAIVMACNTSCAVAARFGGFPPTRRPVLDLIANAAEGLRATPFRRVAVVATAATVRSGAYRRAMQQTAPDLTVIEIAAPLLVPLVEAGLGDSPQARAAVHALRAPAGRIDALVYGCTHYPLLDAQFNAAFGPDVARIDPAVTQATATQALIDMRGLAPGRSSTTYLTNGDLAVFERNVRRWTAETSGTFAAASVLLS